MKRDTPQRARRAAEEDRITMTRAKITMDLRASTSVFGLSLCALCALGGELFSDPPSMTYLFPAGAKAGTTVTVKVGGTFEKWPVSFVSDDDQLKFECGKAKGELKVTAGAKAAPGWHEIRAVSPEGVSSPRVFLVGGIDEILEKEPNDEIGKAQAVTLPTVVNGQLGKSGDVDCFAVSLKAGETLVAALEANRTLRSPMDAILQIVSPEGFVLHHDHDTVGLDPRAVFRAATTGTVLVRVFAFPEKPDSSIRFMGGDDYVYRLTLTTGGFADYTWPLAVEAGKPGQVHFVGPNLTEAKPVEVPQGPPGRVTLSSHNGTSTVPVLREPHPCPALGTITAPLTPPFTLSGRLDTPGSIAIIDVAAKKGERFTIQPLSRELGFATTPLVRVLDETGTQLARGEPSKPETDPTVTLAARVDGTYRIEVRDLFGHGSPRHVFLLRVLPITPDFELSVPTDRLVLTPGKPNDVVVTIVSKNGFRDDVEVAGEGLPSTVTAVSVGEPTKKGANRTVTLRFTAKSAVAATRFRIVGRTQGEKSLTRTATAIVPELPEPAMEIWLTAADSKK